MADRYGTAEAVKIRTGVSAADLGLDTTEALDAFLDDLLDEITDLMDRQMRKSYLTETVPRGLDGIASDVASDSLRVMVATRQTPVVRIDDFAIRIVQARSLSSDVLARLKLYSAGNGVASYDITQPDIADQSYTFTLADLDAE